MTVAKNIQRMEEDELDILLEAQWLRVIMLDNVDGDILNSYTCAQGQCTRPNYGKLSKAKVLQ